MSDKENTAEILKILSRQQMVTGTSEMTIGSIAARQSGGGDGSSQLKNSLESLRRRGLVLLNSRRRNSQNRGGGISFQYSLNSPFLLQKATELKGYTTFSSSTTTRDKSSGAQGKGGPVSLSAVEQLFSITPVATQIFKLFNMGQRGWLRLASVSSEWHDLCRKEDHLELVHFKPRGKCKKGGKLVQLVKSLPDLRHLALTNCDKITDDDLKVLRSLPNLKSLDLSGCDEVTDKGLQVLSSMTSLQNLNLTDLSQITIRGLKALLPLKGSLQNLNLTEILFISPEEKEDFTTLHQLKKLRHLNLTWANISNGSLRQLCSSLPELQSLTLANCRYWTAEGLKQALSSLVHPERLESLDLSFLSVVDDGVLRKILSLLPGLKHLSLSSCESVGLEAPLPFPPSLESLDLSNCAELNETGLRATVRSGKLNNLKHLDLSWNPRNLTDVTMTETLSALSKLRSLDLAGNNKITDQALRTLLANHLPDLRHLDIEDCKRISKPGLDRAIWWHNLLGDRVFLQVKHNAKVQPRLIVTGEQKSGVAFGQRVQFDLNPGDLAIVCWNREDKRGLAWMINGSDLKSRLNPENLDTTKLVEMRECLIYVGGTTHLAGSGADKKAMELFGARQRNVFRTHKGKDKSSTTTVEFDTKTCEWETVRGP